MIEYEVEKILNKKISNGKTFYRIKWKGYSNDQSTWEPEINLQHCKEIIKGFNENLTRIHKQNKIQMNIKPSRTTQRCVSNQKSPSNRDQTKESLLKKARNQQNDESEEMDVEFSNEQHQKKFELSDISNKILSRKTSGFSSLQVQNQETKQGEMFQEREQFEEKLAARIRNKSATASKIEIIKMLVKGKEWLYKVREDNSKEFTLSREQLIKRDPTSIICFYQKYLKFIYAD